MTVSVVVEADVGSHELDVRNARFPAAQRHQGRVVGFAVVERNVAQAVAALLHRQHGERRNDGLHG